MVHLAENGVTTLTLDVLLELKHLKMLICVSVMTSQLFQIIWLQK